MLDEETSPVLARVWRTSPGELTTSLLYRLLRLRVDVFVVEQECAYPELDDRDLEPSTRHLWVGSPADHDDATPAPTGYVRLLTEADGTRRISRMCVAARARGTGIAGTLLRAALAEVDEADAVLSAQTHAVGLYAAYGFTAVGDEYLEDGIPHVDMHRPGPR